MPNIAAVLKAEISRIARREVKERSEEIRKASSQHRSHIAALRRRVEGLERDLKRVRKATPNTKATGSSDAPESVRRRFSATRLATTRKKLGLSAADFGALVGVSGQSIYKWESGEARPRAKQLDAIAAVRGIGKREATPKLDAIRAR